MVYERVKSLHLINTLLRTHQQIDTAFSNDKIRPSEEIKKT